MPQQACAALEAYLAAQTPADTGSATDCPRSGDLKESGQRVTVVGTLDGDPVEIDVTRSGCDHKNIVKTMTFIAKKIARPSRNEAPDASLRSASFPITESANRQPKQQYCRSSAAGQ